MLHIGIAGNKVTEILAKTYTTLNQTIHTPEVLTGKKNSLKSFNRNHIIIIIFLNMAFRERKTEYEYKSLHENRIN